MFTKLFSSITTSSIWNEANNTRIVWITMLAMSNKNGYVSASVGGLAHEARVSREECEAALKVLTSADDDSRSKEHDGRRVEIVDGGFQLLNHAKYRAMRSEEERKEYMKKYMIEYRARTKNVNNDVNNVSECKPPLAKAEADEIRSDNTYNGIGNEVIEYLNLKASTHFRPVKANLDFIHARIKEGASVDDLKAVIDFKCKDWLGKPEAKYLRPETLFNATKFNSYIGLVGTKAGSSSKNIRPSIAEREAV